MRIMSCEKCQKKYSIRTFIRHMKTCDKEKFLIYEEQYKDSTKICICGKKFCEYRTINDCIISVILSEEKKRIYCSKDCYKNNKIPWNKGKTKETDLSIKAIAESRIGKENPIHKVLNNPESRAGWIEKIKRGSSKLYESRQGKTLEELYGEEKAKQIKQKQTRSAILSSKISSTRGMKGKKHSEETKRKIAIKTTEYNSKNRIKTSKIQEFFFNFIQKELSNYFLYLEYPVEFYSLDIAIPSLKIAIEVDGDYWHSNEALGYKPNNSLLERNLKNDTNKQAYLTSLGWRVIRIWESEINKDIVSCVDKIREVINERVGTRGYHGN